MRAMNIPSLFSRAARAQPTTRFADDTAETLESCMRELCEVAQGRREVKDLSTRARHACFRSAAAGSRGIIAACLDAAREYRDRSIALGTPAERYRAPPWSGSGL